MRGWLPGIVAGTVAVLGGLAWPFTVDDAYVLARYADRLRGGLGYTMNDGPPTDGITGPLGLVPALLGGWLVDDPVAGSKLAGLLATSLAVFLAVRAARKGRHQAMCALLLMTAGSLAVWSVGGLETGLAALAFTTMGLAALGPLASDSDSTLVPAPTASRAVVLGVSVAALAWLRPEAAPAALVALLLFRGPGRAWAWGLAGLGLATVVGFRLVLFGVPLPLSSFAKPPELHNGLHYATRALGLVFGGVGVAGLALSLRGSWRAAGLVVVAHLAAVAAAGGDWMPGFRLVAPAVPLYALAGSAAFAERSPRFGWGLAVVSALVPAALLIVTLPQLPEVETSRRGPGRALAERLANVPGPVALVDVGFLAYVSGIEVVDLGGITDPAVGRLPGGHVAKHVHVGLLADRAPAAVVLHSTVVPRVEGTELVGFRGHPVEHRVAAMPWFRSNFEVERVVRYGSGTYYVLMVRRAR